MGVRAARLEWYLWAARDRPDPAELAGAVDRLRELLRAGPLRRTELDALFGPRIRQGIGMYLDMVRVPPSGTWARRRADLFGVAEDWVGPPDVTEEEVHDLLIRRYVGAFEPARRSEIADWTGLPVTTVSKALVPLGPSRGAGRERVDLPDAPLPDPETPAPVRFLPAYDATLLAHARRTLILPEEHRTKVFHVRMPQSIGTFLVDDQVAGTWPSKANKVSWGRSCRCPPAPAREADRLAEFHA